MERAGPAARPLPGEFSVSGLELEPDVVESTRLGLVAVYWP